MKALSARAAYDKGRTQAEVNYQSGEGFAGSAAYRIDTRLSVGAAVTDAGKLSAQAQYQGKHLRVTTQYGDTRMVEAALKRGNFEASGAYDATKGGQVKVGYSKKF